MSDLLHNNLKIKRNEDLINYQEHFNLVQKIVDCHQTHNIWKSIINAQQIGITFSQHFFIVILRIDVLICVNKGIVHKLLSKRKDCHIKWAISMHSE